MLNSFSRRQRPRRFFQQSFLVPAIRSQTHTRKADPRAPGSHLQRRRDCRGGNALQAIARMADGGIADSQSILDQMIAFCGDSISEEDVLQVYGLVSVEQTTDLAKAIASGDYAKILELVDDFDASGRDFSGLSWICRPAFEKPYYRP